MTDAKPPQPEAGPPGRSLPRQFEDGFTQALAMYRIVLVVPVVVLLASAAAAFAYGAEVFATSLAGIFEAPPVGQKGAGVALVIIALTVFLRFGSERDDGRK
jgi:hypothetical protein